MITLIISSLLYRYTYGKPVKGKAVLRLRFGYTFVSYQRSVNFREAENKYISQEFNVSLYLFKLFINKCELVMFSNYLFFQNFDISLVIKKKLRCKVQDFRKSYLD